MTDQDKQIIAFNRGVISKIGHARIDLERYGMSAEEQKNFMPRVLGSMQLRPGVKFLNETNANTNTLSRHLPFIFTEDDTALIEVNEGATMRVIVNDELVFRPDVAATIDNPFFAGSQEQSPPLDWSIDDDPGCTSYVLNADLYLRGSGEGFARCFQTVTVAAPDFGVEHALEITVSRGNCRVRVGSTVQGKEFFEYTLGPGRHNLAFVPSGDFTVELANDDDFNTVVSGCNMDKNNFIEFFTPWSTEAQVRSLRWDQSGDRVYVGCEGVQQKVIERRDLRSWSLVDFVTDDGPFRTQNTGSVSLQVTEISGDYDPNKPGVPGDAAKWVRLVASEPIFETQLQQGVFGPGALFRAESSGQVVTNTKSGAGADVFTDPIRVVGNGDARNVQIFIEGSFTATVKLQFAFDPSGPWNDQGATYNVPTSTTFNDQQDDTIIYYRLACLDADYTSGTVTMTLNYAGGSIVGICRVLQVLDETNARVAILKPFGSIEPTTDWAEGSWSGFRGYPNSVAIHEGRLWWAGRDRIFGSVSDDFESHDDETEGDSGPINRTIGSGAIRVINWMLSMARLILGTTENSANVAGQRMDGNNPLSARSTNFDEPLTPTNFNIKTTSSRGIYVDRTRQRLYELVYDIDIQDFKPTDLSIFAPDFNRAGILQIAVQMKPDIRIHCVRADGTVGVLVYDRAENVISWVDVEIGGPATTVLDVAVLPGLVEDQVYYTIRNSATGNPNYQCLCKWSFEENAIGGLDNYMADLWGQYDDVATGVIPQGAPWLAGSTVTIWGDGAYRGDVVVQADGTIDITGLPDMAAYSNIVYGLQYEGRFKSLKLASIEGIGLLERKRVNKIGFLAQNLHYQGLQYGPDFNNLYDLPLVEKGQETAEDFIWDEYHEDNFGFGGEWDPDSRICLLAQSPKPCTLLAAIAEYQSVERVNRR